MDECVAVAVAEAVAVAVTEAVAEADQSIHDQSIHERMKSTLWGCPGTHFMGSSWNPLYGVGPGEPHKVGSRTLENPREDPIKSIPIKSFLKPRQTTL